MSSSFFHGALIAFARSESVVSEISYLECLHVHDNDTFGLSRLSRLDGVVSQPGRCDDRVAITIVPDGSASKI